MGGRNTKNSVFLLLQLLKRKYLIMKEQYKGLLKEGLLEDRQGFVPYSQKTSFCDLHATADKIPLKFH